MRDTISLNQNWKFIQKDAGLPTSLPQDWQSVCLPHSWNSIDGHDGNGNITDTCRDDGNNLLAIACSKEYGVSPKNFVKSHVSSILH